MDHTAVINDQLDRFPGINMRSLELASKVFLYQRKIAAPGSEITPHDIEIFFSRFKSTDVLVSWLADIDIETLKRVHAAS